MRLTLFIACLVLLTLTACDKQTDKQTNKPADQQAEQQVQQVQPQEQEQQIDPSGIYLMAGGDDLVVIERAAADLSGASAGLLIIELKSVDGKSDHFRRARMEDEYLVISGYQKNQPDNSDEAPESLQYRYKLGPSSTIAGDWNLLQWGDYLFKSEDSAEATRDLKNPVPSFLHRIDDQRIIDYFDALPKNSFGRPGPLGAPEERPQQIAQTLLEDYPDDVYVKSLYLDSLIRKHDIEELQGKLAAWGPEFRQAESVFLPYNLQIAERALQSLELSATGENAADFLQQFLETSEDQRELLELPGILEYEQCLPLASITSGIGDFGDLQIATQVMRTYAWMFVFEGRWQEARELLAACYLTGQQYENSEERLIISLISILIRQQATECLELFALNINETPGEYQQLQETLELLKGQYRERSDQEIREFILRRPVAKLLAESVAPNLPGFYVRYRVPNAKFQVVRAAAAARYRLFTRQEYPASSAEFAPFLPEGLPDDPFSSGTLKFNFGSLLFNDESGEYTVYSVGPDQKDQSGLITYDPTNGTVSSGDIFTRVPRERKYPFPRGGVAADSEEDLLRQFPNGLPKDPFGISRWVPGERWQDENFRYFTDQGAVFLYSIGPDREDERESGGELLHYDPTNGLESTGNIYLRLPNR